MRSVRTNSRVPASFDEPTAENCNRQGPKHNPPMIGKLQILKFQTPNKRKGIEPKNREKGGVPFPPLFLAAFLNLGT